MNHQQASFIHKITNTIYNNSPHHHLHPLAPTLFSRNAKSISLPINTQYRSKTYNHYPTQSQIIGCADFEDLTLIDTSNKCRFLNLSRDDFTASTTIDNSEFIEQFFKNYSYKEKGLLHLPSSRRLPQQRSEFSSVNQAIFDWSKYAHTSEPHIYINYQQATPQAFIDWLKRVSSGKLFQLQYRSLNKENPEQNLLWFNCSTYHTMSEWLANQFEKSVTRFYFSRKDYHSSVKSLKKHMEQQKASKNELRLLMLSLEESFLLLNTKCQKQHLNVKKYQQSYKIDCQLKIINLSDEITKKKKKRKIKHQTKTSESSSLKDKINEQMNPEFLQSINEKQKDISNFETLGDLLLMEKSNSSVVHEGYQETTGTNATQLSYQELKNIQSHQLCGLSQENQALNNQIHQNYCDDFMYQGLQGVNRLASFDNFPEETITERDSNEASDLKKRKKKRKNGRGHNKVIEDFKNMAVSKIINKQLNNLLDSLSTQSNSTYDSKVVVFERIRYFIRSVYPSGDASLFGSNAVGLSLPTSDIDIMLLGLQCKSKEEICDVLAHLAIYINAMGWVISCSTYLNAKVPLVKLQIDTSISYCVPKRKLDYQQNLDPYLAYYLDLRDSSKGVIVKVDITVSTDDSRVSSSTELMRNWLQQKPSLHRILLALKYSLANKGLNENFKGGIGSYCLFVMIAAYFQHFNQKRQDSECQILLDILKFYGEQFQNQLKVINLSEQHSCFLTNEQSFKLYEINQEIIFTNPLKIIDPLNGKLMSSSCFQYNSIKSEWRKIRSQILNIEERIEVQIYLSFNNPSDITKLLSNKKAFDKWINRTQNKIEQSVGSILSRKI